MSKYQPKQIEAKWQKEWEDHKLYETDLSHHKNKYYTLVELPYSSGDLHMGHWFTFSYGDIISRFKRMQGYNVVFPIGFDAFGLPAENAAIKRNIHPQEWTYTNIENMTAQFKKMGNMFDWRYSTIACDPEYYKWNQWIFLKMYEKGIAYKGKVLSNWCPVDQTVLSDENIEAGKCWRCGTEVVKKEVDQWLFKITEYADRLIWPDNPEVDYPKPLRIAQNDWIGRSEGAEIEFKVTHPSSAGKNSGSKIKVFTTRIDTIFGATFLILAPEHQLVAKITTEDKKSEVDSYIKSSGSKTEQARKENKQKTGVFTGSYAINPFNEEEIPIWIADYVLTGYGTGAIMAVPAHDERDGEFAQKFNLPIKTVIEPELGQKRDNEEERKSIVAVLFDPKNKKYLSINWGKALGGNLFIGGGVEAEEDPVEAAKREITEETGYQNIKFISQTEKIHHHYIAHSKGKNRNIEATGLLFELLDDQQIEPHLEEDEKNKFTIEWLTKDEAESRVSEELHSYVFQKLVNGKYYTGYGLLTDSGDYSNLTSEEAKQKMVSQAEKAGFGERKINYHLHDWSIGRQRYWGTPIPIIYCDKDGVVPVPESDLPVKLPFDVDYSPQGKAPLATAEEWVKVKCPKCGGEAKREVDTLDGFMDNSWYFFRYLDPHNDLEIFNKEIINNWLPLEIYIGGAEHTFGHALYSRFFTKFFYDLGLIKFEEYAKKRVHHGVILGPDGHRMSKSRGNVVNPDEQVDNYGADSVRLYLSFLGPLDIVTSWNPDGINGIYHFLQRVWGLMDKIKEMEPNKADLVHLNKTVQKVTSDLEEIKNNTAIASLMEWLNYLSRKETVSKQEFSTFLQLLAPFAPHLTEELWNKLDNKESIHLSNWPEVDSKYLEEDKFNLAIQVNGKLRDAIEVDIMLKANQPEIERLVLASERVQKFLSASKPSKIIYVPGKLINLVS